MAARLDITGLKFGKLTAIKLNGFDQSKSRKHIKWDCSCDCGKSANVRLNSLRSGAIKSCGCLMVGNIKHGKKHTREYQTWERIKSRCYNMNNPDYLDYGGRGIKVCSQWLNSFENFYKDIGIKPSNNHSIDRIDNCGNYEPSNCRWADIKTQSRNKRNNRFYDFNGMNMCMSDWAKYLGVSSSCLHLRLKKWTVEKSLSKFKEK